MDTIFALASARGKSGVAVVRISGPDAHRALGQFCAPVQSRGLRKLYFEDSLLDEALVLSFAAPNSFTGEDVVELHLHGSPAIINAVLTSLSLENLPGALSKTSVWTWLRLKDFPI